MLVGIDFVSFIYQVLQICCYELSKLSFCSLELLRYFSDDALEIA